MSLRSRAPAHIVVRLASRLQANLLGMMTVATSGTLAFELYDLVGYGLCDSSSPTLLAAM